MSCKTRIQKAYDGAVRLPLDECSRYVLISDCHRGTGTVYDNFLKNRHLYLAALEYYYRRNFFYIELGDGEELWENRDRNQIQTYHEDVYGMLCRFRQQGRMLRLFGNHNMELREKQKKGAEIAKNDRRRCKTCENFLKEDLKESALLQNCSGGRDICLLHGHQADFFNSVLWKLSRFLVRYLWKPLEHFGVNDPTSAAKNFKKQSRYERCLAEWAKDKDMYLAAGHSHRPALPGEGGLYINTGSCVHPSGITAVEIENMKMTLVKWQMSTRPDMTLFVERVVIAGPVAVE
ncbi:MAG: metallophosphoesterase family protein [Roseburia sp.]|nr:metallophosphoesterase family protein [Roseburia sp.]